MNELAKKLALQYINTIECSGFDKTQNFYAFSYTNYAHRRHYYILGLSIWTDNKSLVDLYIQDHSRIDVLARPCGTDTMNVHIEEPELVRRTLYTLASMDKKKKTYFKEEI